METKIRNMEDFAKASGISRPTISKYFNDPNAVRNTTRERIEQALETYDYRPNIFAMNQNRKLTRNIGVVVPSLADPFFAEIARNVERRCIDAGYQPTLYSAHGNRDQEVEILDSLRSLKPAGLLIAPLGRNSDKAMIEKFSQKVPTVLFDSYLPDIGLSFGGSDNFQFGRLIVDYLCRTGTPPCFFEMQNPANPNANKRRQGYIAAMEALGHAPQVVSVTGEGWNFEEIGRNGGLEVIDSDGFPSDTVLCSNDRLAIGLISACFARKIPVGFEEDSAIRIAGMDDHPFSRFTCPPLTTISQDYEAISKHAVETLFGNLEGDEITDKVVLFEGNLIMRKSA
ncbi:MULTISPECIES: LacI family DNA-binding transcriptional regulator [Rhodobacterales]|uniref:LacI family DNA-binding transcriptional regulator n=1 Tax=Rhodobacterales TaxID=204455 RepID=UPI00215DB486|nr:MULTISPECIES: LacI family DNA-binding transcriptional regulator [Rhodobacterales]MDO6590369.1 LacI family DNA-binding transcriptional regulator [Yoonia sp. 1_MG-2023]